jgi:hypothetical protein
MAHFKKVSSKTAGDDFPVTLYKDSIGAYYVGHPGDRSTHPIPMGAFASRQAARRWADRRFPGGRWA